MPSFKCLKGCCELQIEPYHHPPNMRFMRKRRKAGVLIHNPQDDRILLVQSRGYLWGLPKGSVNIGETERQCAVREVLEETGLSIQSRNFLRATKINRSIYFYLEADGSQAKVQSHLADNDANGVAWVKLSCLNDLLLNGNLEINNHCRLVLRNFLRQEMPSAPVFQLVEKN